MKKIKWEITNNFRTGSDFKEYDKNTYECREDDIWVSVETPLAEAKSKD